MHDTIRSWFSLALPLLLVGGLAALAWITRPLAELPAGREEVVFWHFWGGADRTVVEEIVDRFNDSQQKYFVRAVAMPGNNLDMKMFLAVSGGDPPDLVNQDDPIVADWAHRGALIPLDEIAPAEEIAELENWLLPAARQLGTYQGQLYGLCNGLDIRALYYNRRVIQERTGKAAPESLESIDQLDELADACVERENGRLTSLGYLPDPRRLWSWGVVFGGRFIDPASGQVTPHDPAIVRALEWMVSYRDKWGADTLAAFRQGDQALPGTTFPLLSGRYAIIMDGQWRVRDIPKSRSGDFGVWELPPPAGSSRQADGWVNGNLFLVPRGCRTPRGAWEFMKFWSGFGGHEAEAARTCSKGGWIPPSQQVIDQPHFQQYLQQNPLFGRFVELAAGKQVPTPVIPGARMYDREVITAAQRALYTDSPDDAASLLQATAIKVQQHVDRVRKKTRAQGGNR
jgi:multiple sugar transport system substrate-binding protein